MSVANLYYYCFFDKLLVFTGMASIVSQIVVVLFGFLLSHWSYPQRSNLGQLDFMCPASSSRMTG